MAFTLAITLVVLQVLSVHANFVYHDRTPASSPMHVNHIHLTDPIMLPGSVTVSFDGSLNSSISHSKLQVILKKKHALFGLDLSAPCLDHVGTCDYDDICTILNDMDTGNWGFGALRTVSREINSMFKAHNINATTCPFNPGHIHVENFVLQLPHVASGLSWFAAGDYYAEIKITDKASGNVILWLDATIHLKQAPKACTGLACIIGK